MKKILIATLMMGTGLMAMSPSYAQTDEVNDSPIVQVGLKKAFANTFDTPIGLGSYGTVQISPEEVQASGGNAVFKADTNIEFKRPGAINNNFGSASSEVAYSVKYTIQGNQIIFQDFNGVKSQFKHIGGSTPMAPRANDHYLTQVTLGLNNNVAGKMYNIDEAQ